jgi:hypothetical protein
LWRSSSGITRSLQTMVDRAMVSTMTMPVARRQTTDEHQQRQPLLPLRHRQGQHEGVGIDSLPRKMQQTAERDRQNEELISNR